MRLTQNQSHKIQILRGLAIIAVVFIHNTPGGVTQIFCRPFLNFCVGLFLFLSGMLSSADNWKPGKRILKIAIPYVIWTLIYVVMGNYETPSSIPAVFLKMLVTGRAKAIMYFVFVYCECTLLVPLIDKLARSKYKYLGFAITPLEILFLRLLPLVTGWKINRYVSMVMGVSCLCWFSFFYFGYLMGNKLMKIRSSTFCLACIWAGSIVLQILEGCWYYSMGVANCGTQSKLTSVFTGLVFAALAYRFVMSDRSYKLEWLRLLGDNSFGIYFSHLAVMTVINHIPHYEMVVIYPFNAVIAVAATLCCVLIGKKLLGRYGKYLAL